MASYDYKCTECGEFEVQQSMKEDAYVDCPKCGKSGVVRLVSGGTGTHYKAAGFYKTDYRKVDSNITKYLPNSN